MCIRDRVCASSSALPSGAKRCCNALIRRVASMPSIPGIRTSISTTSVSYTHLKADNVRVVGLTSDPNGAYSYYGGAIVGSDNLLAAMQGTDDFDTTGTTTVYLDLALDGNSVSAKTINSVKALLPKHFDLMSRQQVSRCV